MTSHFRGVAFRRNDGEGLLCFALSFWGLAKPSQAATPPALPKGRAQNHKTSLRSRKCTPLWCYAPPFPQRGTGPMDLGEVVGSKQFAVCSKNLKPLPDAKFKVCMPTTSCRQRTANCKPTTNHQQHFIISL